MLESFRHYPHLNLYTTLPIFKTTLIWHLNNFSFILPAKYGFHISHVFRFGDTWPLSIIMMKVIKMHIIFTMFLKITRWKHMKIPASQKLTLRTVQKTTEILDSIKVSFLPWILLPKRKMNNNLTEIILLHI